MKVADYVSVDRCESFIRFVGSGMGFIGAVWEGKLKFFSLQYLRKFEDSGF